MKTIRVLPEGNGLILGGLLSNEGGGPPTNSRGGYTTCSEEISSTEGKKQCNEERCKKAEVRRC